MGALDTTAGSLHSGATYAAHAVSVRYGGVQALEDVTFEVRPGEVHGLLGANGAGKSSLVKVLAGVQRPQAGTLTLDGREVGFGSGREAVRAGIATVSQELNLFGALTVLENLFLMREPSRAGMVDRPTMRRRALPALEAVGLPARVLDQPLRTLSLAAQQLVEITRALLETPSVLILDEPTSALKAAETRRLLDVVAQMRSQRVGVVLVSHFLEDVLGSADVLTVLRGGRTVEQRLPVAELTSQSLIDRMLGPAAAAGGVDRGSHRLPIGSSPRERGLTLRDVAVERVLEPLTLSAEPGEVVGLAGLDGSGASETLRVLFGQLRSSGGTVELPNGRPGPRSMRSAVRAGIAYIPADRKELGLVLEAPVYENVATVTQGPLRRSGVLPRTAPKLERARTWCDAIGIRAPSVRARTSTLSGGNQQKVVFAKWLETVPDVVLLDDPTRGVDVGAKADMMAIIREVAASGRVVLYASSDLAELAQTCDRAVVFYRGRAVGQLRPPFDEHTLLDAITTGVVPADPAASQARA